MSIQWNDSLAVGIEAIDVQHKGIFSMVNNMLSAMSQGKGTEEVGMFLNTKG